ncbi:MAG: hypothetical protein ACE10G_01550 [Gemmatimonadales bacterium]
MTWINSKFIDERDIQMVPWVSPYDEGDAATTALPPFATGPAGLDSSSGGECAQRTSRRLEQDPVLEFSPLFCVWLRLTLYDCHS